MITQNLNFQLHKINLISNGVEWKELSLSPCSRDGTHMCTLSLEEWLGSLLGSGSETYYRAIAKYSSSRYEVKHPDRDWI